MNFTEISWNCVRMFQFSNTGDAQASGMAVKQGIYSNPAKIRKDM